MTVWITGASSGLGLATMNALVEAGYQVIAGARSFREPTTEGKLHRLPLDVNDAASCRAFAEAALRIDPTVDALIHCAGILILGTAEETSIEEYRSVLETDFLGMVRMNQAVLPTFRRQKAGKIIMYSSVNGLLGIPCQSAYTAAKHAVEGYAECLALETAAFGVQVTLVEPGDHRSGSHVYRRHAAAMGDASPYAEAFASAVKVIERDENSGGDPNRLGRKVAGLVSRKKLPFRYRVTRLDESFAVWIHDLLPASWNRLLLKNHYLGQ